MTLNLDYLLERGQAAEHEVAEQLVAHYYAPIHALALSMLHDDDEADEVAQQTMIRAAQRIGQYKPHSNLRAWVYKIGLNICRNHIRKRETRQRALAVLTLGMRRESAPSPELQTAQSEQDATLWRLVNTLADKHRVPLILRFSHDMTTPEIAEILNLPAGTVRSRLHYAQRTLHGLLSAEKTFTGGPA